MIYRPETKRWSHDWACSLPRQFGADAWFEETAAVITLPTEVRPGDEETYPFGLWRLSTMAGRVGITSPGYPCRIQC